MTMIKRNDDDYDENYGDVTDGGDNDDENAGDDVAGLNR